MSDLQSTYGVRYSRPGAHDTHLKIERLKAQLLSEDEFIRIQRDARVEAQKNLMLSPVSTPEAFALFGTLLGLLPPAAIFYRLFGYGIFRTAWGTRPASDDSLGLFALCLAMNAVCCLVGRVLGRQVGRLAEELEKRSWGWTFVVPTLMGIVWGVGTGAAGGGVFFIVGALAGVFFAAPTGALAFAVFTPFHRMLACGGMIDVRHLAALLFGVVGSMVSLIITLDSF